MLGMDVTTDELLRIRDWAKGKVAQGAEPPWAWYQYMKLIEAIEAICAGRAATQPMENLPRSESRPGARLQLVGSKCQPDTAPPHHACLPVQMPM